MLKRKISSTMTLIIGIMLVVAFVSAFTACTGTRDKALVGRWKGGGIVLAFYKNGKGEVEGDDHFTWDTVNGRLSIVIDRDGKHYGYVQDYSIYNNGSSLSIDYQVGWPWGSGRTGYDKLGH